MVVGVVVCDVVGVVVEVVVGVVVAEVVGVVVRVVVAVVVGVVMVHDANVPSRNESMTSFSVAMALVAHGLLVFPTDSNNTPPATQPQDEVTVVRRYCDTTALKAVAAALHVPFATRRKRRAVDVHSMPTARPEASRKSSHARSTWLRRYA